MTKEKTAPGEALFIGAHPDDIEIGAGGTVAKLSANGWQVYLCILTSEADPGKARERRNEAIAAAAALGVGADKIFFLELPDTKVKCDGDSVGKLRKIVKENNLKPDVVFTHTIADDHNDHRAAHDITLGAFREKVIFAYPIVNSLKESHFTPKVFVDISGYRNSKLKALEEHRSQSKHGRIMQPKIEKLGEKFSGSLPFAEPFEVIVQEGGYDGISRAFSINDCNFYKFWNLLIEDRPLTIIYSLPAEREKKDGTWQGGKERKGVSLLSRSFNEKWYGSHPIESLGWDDARTKKLLSSNDILLSGGAVSNEIVRTHFNHFKGVRYVIDYVMPNFTNIHIFDKVANKHIYAKYAVDENNNLILRKDLAILTIMQNPMIADRNLIGCMGIHGYGTLSCFKVLSDRHLLSELTELMDLPLKAGGFQVLLENDVGNDKIKFMKKSLHTFQETN